MKSMILKMKFMKNSNLMIRKTSKTQKKKWKAKIITTIPEQSHQEPIMLREAKRILRCFQVFRKPRISWMMKLGLCIILTYNKESTSYPNCIILLSKRGQYKELFKEVLVQRSVRYFMFKNSVPVMSKWI